MRTTSDNSEFDLDPAVIRTLLKAQFPGFAVQAVEYLHEGWDNSAFLVNGDWIFRFPKRRERQPWLESEIEALRWLGAQPLPVSVPAPVYVGKPGPHYPCSFMGYPMLKAISGDHMTTGAVDRMESARRLGELFTIVHSLDVRQAESLGVHSFRWPLEDALAEAASMSATIGGALPAPLKPLCRPFLDGSCQLPVVAQQRRCLVHGDLADEHLLFDAWGRVCGVIDWGDCGICDPTTDFAGLYAWLGKDFVRDVLARYRHPVDPSFLPQIAFRARCSALTNYGYSLQGRATSGASRLQMIFTAFDLEAPMAKR